jgi:hypothetical protein
MQYIYKTIKKKIKNLKKEKIVPNNVDTNYVKIQIN